MAEDKTGYTADLDSFKRIGRAVREVETNLQLPATTLRRASFVQQMVEGVFLEDMLSTIDPNTPSGARFQIQTALHGLDGWAKLNSPSIIPVWNRTTNCASEGDVGFAKEMYPNKWYWVSGGSRNLQVVLSGDLFAAVNTKRDPSTAIARVLVKKANGDLKLSTREITIVNRFINISIDQGTYCKAEWIDGEWQLYAADCPGGSSSSGSV